MKLFGHHIGRSSALFASVDASLFLGLFAFINILQPCPDCLLAGPTGVQLISALALTSLLVLIACSIGLYNNDATEDFGIFRRRFLRGWPLVLLPGIAGFTLTYAGSTWRLPALLSIVALLTAGLLLVSFLLRVWLIRGVHPSFLRKRLIVLGSGHMAEAICTFVQGPGRSHFRHLQTIPCWQAIELPAAVGNLSLKETSPNPVALCNFAQSLRAEEIVVALDDRRSLPTDDLVECKLKGIAVVDAQTFWERETGQIDPSLVGAEWLAFSGGFAFGLRRRLFKRLTDIVLSLVFIVCMLPLALCVALAIKLESPGPLFYRQERVGLNGRPFALWKFRSMRTDAECDGVPKWANSVDDRVTRVGLFIRKVRLDEIPQAFNVLAGEMSFIGPRPERPFFVDQLKQVIPHYDLRHRVRPGITGWAQVNYPYGASIEDARRKLAYDLYYLKKNDFVLDVAILIQTVRVIVFAQGGR